MKYLDKNGLTTLVTNMSDTFSKKQHEHTISQIADYSVDASLSSTSANPIQNKTVKTAIDDVNANKVPVSRTINGKPLSNDITLSAEDVGAKYDVVSTTAPGLVPTRDGSTSKYLRADGTWSAIPVDNIVSHVGDKTIHVTAEDKTNLKAAKTHADSAHAPANAEANQNAFSNVAVGSTTIAADTKTDTLTLAGSNVTLTTDAANDKLTIGITKANVTSALGYTPPTTNTTYDIVSTTANGLVPKRDGSKNKYLCADGTWAVPPDTNTTYKTGDANIPGLTKLYTAVGTNTDGAMTQNAVSSALNSKAESAHKHSASDITSGVLSVSNGGTGTSTVDGVKTLVGLNPVVTAGTGDAYTATVNGIASLYAGASFMMVPHVASTTTSPTLNVNGLGDVFIRRRISNSTLSTVAGSSNNWLGANKPIKVVYDGKFWIAEFTQPNAADIYGAVPIENGGTGATNAADARKNLGIDGSANTWNNVKTPGEFYKSAEAPTSDIVGKYDGYFYATRVYNAVWNDYAELFEAAEKVEVGHIAYARQDGFVVAHGAPSCAVGVVSDRWGHLLGGTGDHNSEDYAAISLAGRVPVEVRGEISVGDLIAACEDGIGRKATKEDFGCIIGKCVGTDPDGREGFVNMLVGMR